MSHVPNDLAKSELYPGAINLLTDNETEVRSLLCLNLSPFYAIVGGETFLSEIVRYIIMLLLFTQ